MLVSADLITNAVIVKNSVKRILCVRIRSRIRSKQDVSTYQLFMSEYKTVFLFLSSDSIQSS